LENAVLLPLIVTLSVLYTYTNGFQDGSSVAASAIACRAMSRAQCIFVVATFEFLGALLGGSAVANTIHSITSWPDRADLLPVLSSGLFAAIMWNFITKLLKVPSSSTHALVGGMLGAIFAASGGFQLIVWGSPFPLSHPTGVWKVICSLFISPLVGFGAGYLCFVTVLLLLMRASTRVNVPLKQLQALTVAALAFGHGANDTQKAMGVLLLALSACGFYHQGADIPLWIRLLSGTAMVAGIVSMAPGIMKRVGSGIYRLRPVHGFVTQLAAAVVVGVGSYTGGPVSASQVIASTVMGVGTAERRKGVHWLVARDMFLAWFLTIPCAGFLAACVYVGLFHYLNLLIHTAAK